MFIFNIALLAYTLIYNLHDKGLFKRKCISKYKQFLGYHCFFRTKNNVLFTEQVIFCLQIYWYCLAVLF